MIFKEEKDFEKALVSCLSDRDWEKDVLKNPSEQDLIKNWADILLNNNSGIDRLNNYPLTDGEMAQIIEQVEHLRTPLRLNSFINGGSVSIVRDNPDDKEHFGKEVSLKIYERREIAAGQSKYQIAEQPKFSTKSKLASDRRGDVMLLINGMPVIHIELKKSGVPVSQATNQIEKYAKEGVFTGLFSLVQVFVAMNPDETVYFANPGPDGKFNHNFFFHWADFSNQPINDWKTICNTLLSIPMAHELIGFYTIADDTDGVLKVLRSYQYYAVNRISDKVATNKWNEKNQLGGYIWHTTGSGKTMTSFKAAHLISTSQNADKVVFLVNRIELGTQSLNEYRNFAGAGLSEAQKENTVQETEDTYALVGKLKSNDANDTLIVTSIQKMSNISDENKDLKSADIDSINMKRLVFIIDECHRSTFGDMLLTIKKTFPNALFFGFTGTPIHEENQIKMNTTATIFGDELHRYSIADGIRDKNVLGFDPYKVLTFKDSDVRKAVALEKAKSKTVSEVFADQKKNEVFNLYMNDIPMAGHVNPNGTYEKGIEDFIPKSQYRTEEHQSMVVQDVVENWEIISQGGKFHAIFATESIPEAIEYYHRFKKAAPHLKITALFDSSIDNNEGAIDKENGLIEIIDDYNKLYDQQFTIPTFAKMKKDIAARLAHKKPYERIEIDKEKQIDLLIVVYQMLTGYDSKWINALYLDRLLWHALLIQAFSRTNRLFGPDKPFGTIKYYRKPHTMERNILEAIKEYSGDKPFGIFAQRLQGNLEQMNLIFEEIKEIFESSDIENFEKNPGNPAYCKKFAVLFNEFNDFLEAAKIQGFTWNQKEYTFKDTETGITSNVVMLLDEMRYLILAKRYKELFEHSSAGTGDEIKYDIKGYLTTIDTDKIDSDFMNAHFEKFLKVLYADNKSLMELQKVEEELHKTFATLSQEEQKYANVILHDIQSGDLKIVIGKTFREYITDYCAQAKNDQVHRLVTYIGIDETMLRNMMKQHVTTDNINEFGRFDALKATIDKTKAKSYFEAVSKTKLPMPKVNIRVDKLLREFILKGGFDIDTP